MFCVSKCSVTLLLASSFAWLASMVESAECQGTVVPNSQLCTSPEKTSACDQSYAQVKAGVYHQCETVGGHCLTRTACEEPAGGGVDLSTWDLFQGKHYKIFDPFLITEICNGQAGPYQTQESVVTCEKTRDYCTQFGATVALASSDTVAYINSKVTSTSCDGTTKYRDDFLPFKKNNMGNAQRFFYTSMEAQITSTTGIKTISTDCRTNQGKTGPGTVSSTDSGSNYEAQWSCCDDLQYLLLCVRDA